MYDCTRFYIDGSWVEPSESERIDVVDPATERAVGQVALGDAADVDRAVAAARRAFDAQPQASREERVALLRRILEAYRARADEIAVAISHEMGAPITLARQAHARMGVAHLEQMIAVLDDYPFERELDGCLVVREPIGVCGLITPWNWPINQIACKVAPALAAGCTMVLKPSEIAPVSGTLFAEVLDAAGVPAGVFNLVHGDGPTVGAAIASHPGVDMVSFTGSTRAGTEVARNAAATVKRVAQELGGKSANIILDDADLEEAVSWGVERCYSNGGQTCTAPSRMLVPESRRAEAVEIARAAVDRVVVGDPRSERTTLGPMSSRTQFEKVQALIEKGIAEGAELVSGGPGRPEGLETGFYVRPTVFAGVTNDMTIAREEIFGPVLSILTYRDEDEAVAIANDSPYGLSGCVQSADPDRARRVASRMRTGMVIVNRAASDPSMPFGGYKQSGNGREWGVFGLEEYLETKSLVGCGAES